MRAFILIAILGGLALAGGLYFGGGLGNAPNPEQAVQDVPTTPPVGEEPATADDPSGGVNVTDAATTAPPQQQQQPTAQERRQAELERQRREAQQNDGPPPAPTNSWTAPQQASNGTGGPVSLRPNENQGSSASVPIPPPIVQPDVQPASTTTATTQAPLRTTAGTVLWAARPSASRISDLYPARAMRDNVGGRVELDCVVQASLALACTVARETPASLGFARAALSAASSYRARPELSSGTSSVGARTRIAIQFQAPGE